LRYLLFGHLFFVFANDGICGGHWLSAAQVSSPVLHAMRHRHNFLVGHGNRYHGEVAEATISQACTFPFQDDDPDSCTALSRFIRGNRNGCVPLLFLW